MISFSALPTSLVALLIASAVFAVPPTSPNDPFRAIALLTHREPEPPVCCLKPLPPLEPVDDDVLLSFEEWKAKQFQLQQAEARDREIGSASTSTMSGGTAEPAVSAAPDTSSLVSLEQPIYAPEEVLPPHFRVPITDRFNYASDDCSARVHTAHRSAKSPSSILSSKKDRYMLSPCMLTKGEKQFVVVELCDDIRIDTVQLANYEFFSGVFKDFTVSVSKTYTTDEDGWTLAGTYRAKNIRGIQSFHPPTSLRDFYRYIRIDFHSHYGNEYYCPISLLRVYGLTHLEEFKWDIWEAESVAKHQDAYAISPVHVVHPPEPAQSSRDQASAAFLEAHVSSYSSSEFAVPSGSTREELNDLMDRLESKDTLTNASETSYEAEKLGTHHDSSSSHISDSGSIVSSAQKTSSTDSHSTEQGQRRSRYRGDTKHTTSVVQTTVMTSDDTRHTVHDPSSPTSSAVPLTDTTHSGEPSSSADARSAPYDTVGSSQDPHPPNASAFFTVLSTASVISSPAPVVPSGTGGESIYRTIMNRLTALEANHSLHARYLEEQTAGVREVLRRLGEDVGRLEGIGQMQAQMYQRSVHEWERQRRRLEMEHGELMSRVNYLADEIVLEKRLGIAQLCLLLAVLIFIGLTRGSRGEPLVDQHPPHTHLFNKSVREWGRRNLSFSGDWVNRFSSHSLSQSPSPPQDLGLKDGRGKRQVAPPHAQPSPPPDSPGTSTQVFPSISDSRVSTGRKPANRSRTPILRSPTRAYHTPRGSGAPSVAQSHSHTHSHLHSSAQARPRIMRTNSHGASPHGFAVIGPVPRSAKRWAKSAHLHEVKQDRDKNRDKEESVDASYRRIIEQENDPEDVQFVHTAPLERISSENIPLADDGIRFSSGKRKAKASRQRIPLSPLDLPRRQSDTESTDHDMWIDTDMESTEIDNDNVESDGAHVGTAEEILAAGDLDIGRPDP